MYKGKKILAVVPARSGSKRVPGKNMRKIMGISLIGWAGKCLQKLDWIDKKIISTDSWEYAVEGNKFGLELPFLRPKHLAQGQAGSIVPVMVDIIKRIPDYDILLLIEPSSPLREPEDIEGVVDTFCNLPAADAVLTMSLVSERYHPERFTEIDIEDRLYFSSVAKTKSTRELYSWNGVCYAYDLGAILLGGGILPHTSYIYKIDRPVVNIDTETDFEFAEFLMDRRYRKN